MLPAVRDVNEHSLRPKALYILHWRSDRRATRSPPRVRRILRGRAGILPAVRDVNEYGLRP
jgi:hypothetical protein